MKNLFKYTFIILLGALMTTATAIAQQQQMPPQPEPLSPEEVTDEDLQTLSDITKIGQGIQEEAEAKMKVVVEEGGIEFQRFQQIMMAQQNPQLASQIELTEGEQSTLQELQPDLMEINQEAQQQYIAAIEEEGMGLERFQQVAQAIQAHPEVAERFQEINSEEDSEGDDG
jgi:hypothetical protein